ncbi:MAG: hypothetical protein KGI28_07745 [Thaumarchaeota archaeon]|nr:hypothetical protein [Nitrososphaerota archaeon]
MKTLHLGIIVGIVIIGSGTDTSFGQYPEYMPHAMISLYTDKQNYGYSDTVIISGDIDKNDFKSLSWLDIEIRDPNGVVYKNDVIPVNSTGHYTYKLKILQNFTSGQYLIRVSNPSYHEVDLGNSFYVNLENQVMAKNDLGDGNIFNIQASDFGLPGDTIEINGNLVTKDSIKIMLHDPDGITRYSTTTFADRNGEFTSQLKVPNDAVSGLWKIVGNSGIYHRELNFTVSGYSSLQTCYGFHCTQSNSTGITTTWPNMHGNNSGTLQSPLKQFKSGIKAEDVKCGSNLHLIIKAEDNSPACVKPQTAQKLVERGWGWAMQTMDSLKPLLPNRIMGLENDTGIVTLRNQTYYFETPRYTDAAFIIPVQISFHDVVFTLFPSGFKGGLPTDFGGVATNGCDGSYFWTDAKFPDGIHELLHLFAITTMSQHCQVLPAPTDFSTHANPQAGLTWYNGKMKLLVSTNNPKLTHMNIKVFSSYTPSSLADHFLVGNLYSTTEPIQNGNITITVNGSVMGTTLTYPNGCFQFNNWNDSKLADQINKSKSLGMSSMELNFQTQYLGDSDHNPANASAISYLNFYAVPLAPAQYDTEVYPSNQINVTQGDSAQFHITVKPFSKYWEVGHMKLNLQRMPCGLSYHISPVDKNDSVLVNNTASFDVVMNSTSYTPSGKYWISIDQDLSGINEPNIDSNVGAFFLNVLKK